MKYKTTERFTSVWNNIPRNKSDPQTPAYGVEVPEVEVGEGLQVAQVGGQRAHPIVVKAERLQRDELAEVLRQLTQSILWQICKQRQISDQGFSCMQTKLEQLQK